MRRLVPKRGLEPLRDFSHSHLKAACLPVPPPRRYQIPTVASWCYQKAHGKCTIFKGSYQILSDISLVALISFSSLSIIAFMVT